MESIISFACHHANSAHWFIFLLLLLAGFNVPISEDLMLITGGAIASICIPEHVLRLFIWIYFGCWFSAWIAYGIGRTLGPKLYTIRWFSHVITPKRIEKLHHYYEKFGVFTFVVGRFFPGGVRNALFMTAGLGKMPFHKFILRDGFACLISATTLFSLGYYFGENYQTIIHYFIKYDEIIIGIIVCIAIILALLLWRRSRNKMVI